MDKLKKDHKKLLRPGETVDYSRFPWPVPQKGDTVRAEMLFDQDPAGVIEGKYGLVKAVANCEVWVSKMSASPPDHVIFFKDIEKTPKPKVYSLHGSGSPSTWGGVAFWDDKRTPTNVIPLYAIRKGLLTRFAQKLTQRAEAQDRGIYA